MRSADHPQRHRDGLPGLGVRTLLDLGAGPTVARDGTAPTQTLVSQTSVPQASSPPRSEVPVALTPYSAAAERAVLGGILLDPARLNSLSDHIAASDFYFEAHRKLWTLFCSMADRGAPIELVSVVETITRSPDRLEYGELSAITSLADDLPSSGNLEYYAQQVRDRATERRVLEAARGIIDSVRDGQHSATELVQRAESSIYSIGESLQTGDWQLMGSVVEEEFARLQQLAQNPGAVTGISTGLVDLDRILAGLHRTDLIILAARPAMGKTALALNIARNVAALGHGVGIFSLEMSAGQLTTRILVAASMVRADAVRTGRLDRDRHWPRLQAAAEEVYRLPIHIDDTPGQSIGTLRAKARRLKARHPDLALIVVDYIGLMSGEGGRANRQEQIAEASRGLKTLAKELDVTVLALSQLNRAVENRDHKIPQMSDLRESGAIEQDADIILFIYRDEYYNKETTTRPGEADVIVAKQRNGATGTVPLAFRGEYTLFSNLARPSETALADGYM